MNEQTQDYEISGLVTGRNGDPLRNARVVVWWQQIRERRELAVGETSEHGHYHLRYRIPEDAPKPLQLIVEALSEYLDAPLFSQQTAAQKTLVIDLSLEPADQSEWATLIRSIEPFLGGLTLAEVVESTRHHDISFLATETGNSTDTIMRVAVSARLQSAYKIAAPAFYAFLRQNVPAALPASLLDASQNFELIDVLVQSVASMIFGLSAAVQTQTLTAAVALDLIGPQFTSQIAQLVTELQSQQAADLLGQTYLVGSATLAQLLDVASIPAAKQQAFAQTLSTNSQSMRNFWRTLSNGRSGFTAAEASGIERTLSVGAFVKNFVPLLQNLLEGFNSGTYKVLSDLARLSKQDWVQLVNQTGAPPNVDAAGTASPAQVFAAVVYTRVTRAFPTAALSSRISGSKFIPTEQQQPLIQFFQNNSGLELITDNLAVYLANEGAKAFTGINIEDQAAVVANAKSLQRVLRITPDPDAAQTLLLKGITSATQIAALGRQQFFIQATAAGLSKTEANKAFQVAQQRYANVVALYMQFNRDSLGLWPQALGSLSNFVAITQQAIQTDPSLATLFGSQSYCATDDCTTVLSPAAYLCDLLLWLRNHPQAGGTVLDVLDSRRPDIRHLLLNCPNSDTELPYIDLVIELLADKISPAPSTTLAASITATQLSITVATYAGLPTPNFTVLIGAEVLLVTAVGGVGNTSWTVLRAQQNTTAAIGSAGDAVILTTTANPPWKQTPENASSAQLSAAPVYFNQGAFSTLFTASYPQSLPYSAGLDELRTYLQQWKLPLWQLRQALLPITGAGTAQQAAVAAERLAMNLQAENLVTQPNFVPVSVAWNISNPESALTSVPAFLQAGSITYESLLELIQVSWVQGGLGVSLLGVSDTCDISFQILASTWTTLTVAIDATQTSITVASDNGFPAPNFFVTIGSEVLEVTAAAGAGNTTWTVTRHQQGTTAAAAVSGAFVAGLLDDGFLDRASRFLRLWTATGYDMWELDLLLNAASVGGGAINQNTLIGLQSFWQLQNATGLAVDQQLALYQDIDSNTHRDPDGTTTTPLYSQIFLNPTTTWIAPDPDLASLLTGGAIGDPLLSDHAKSIQPALGMTASDLASLFALTDNSLTLANLSLIYRINELARVSKFSISSLLGIAKLLSPAAAAPATALSAAITDVQNTITVVSATLFGPPNFLIEIGAETLLVTAMGGPGNTTWTVVRAQSGTAAIGAAAGAPVTSDSASPAVALAALFSSPAATLTFLQQAIAVQKQTSLTIDAITYLLTPPSSITQGWITTSQMTPANIAATLVAVQQAVLSLLSASTTLASGIAATDTTITVAGDAGFPAPNFYVYLGSEILLVTAVSGPGNATWTVVRGQQGTAQAAAPTGASLTPTAGDLNGAVISAVAATAHAAASAPLASDATAIILQNLQLPGSGQPLLSVLLDPAMLAATGTITIGGSPVVGDTLQVVLSDGVAPPVNVLYPLVPADAGSVNQTATDFANAINLSSAVAGPAAFLAPCTVAGRVISISPLTPGAAGSSITATNTANPGGSGHVSISPTTTQTIGQTAFAQQFLAIQLLDKVAVLCRGLRLVAANVSWLLENSANPAVGGLDLTKLPVTVAQPALSLVPLLTTFLLIKLSRLWTAAQPASAVQTLYDIIGGVLNGNLADEAATQNSLATITGWPLADIESFAAALGLTFPASYASPASYDALRTLEAMSAAVNVSGPVSSGSGATLAAAITDAQLSITVVSAIGFPAPNFYINIGAEILLVTAFGGGDNTTWTVLRAQQGTSAAPAANGAAVTLTYGAQIVSWGGLPADEASAESMAAAALGILKAQQPSEGAWLALAPTLMNPLRQNQSAALQSYLTAQRDGSGNLIYGDTDGLFDYFLIDTQMTSCQVTSRVVQAYIAVQIFVERCRMNLEAPEVVVNLDLDDTWNQWEWMSRYRIWEANREVFLYPENWLIESERPNRTEIYQKFEQEVRQGQSTADYFESVVLNYIDRLDGLAHLLVTGTCEDPETGTIYVVSRTLADPPVFYLRSYVTSAPGAAGAWGGWAQIPLDIKAHQVIPALYRGRICLFWLDVKSANEPKQPVPAAQASSTPAGQNPDRFVSLSVNFSIFRNGSWAPAQAAKGKLFDKPIFDPTTQATDSKSIESLYTVKVQAQPSSPGVGTALFIDVFRLGNFQLKNLFNEPNDPLNYQITGVDDSVAIHLGRAIFDGRFSDLELQNLLVPTMFENIPSPPWYTVKLLTHAKSVYGPDAKPLLALSSPDPNLVSEPSLAPEAGALAGYPGVGANSPVQLNFTSAGALEQNVGPLLNTASLPMRVVGPDSNLNFDPTSYFFFQDNRRCYWAESQKYYQTGSAWSPLLPSAPGSAPYQLQYVFHPFYHPFTRLFWNQLAGGDFDLLYDVNLQQVPDTIDPGYSDVFSFQNGYQPTWRVQWDHASAATTLAENISSAQTTITVTNNIWIPSPAFYVNIGSELLQVTAASGTNNTTWTVTRGAGAVAAPSGTPVTPTFASQDRQFLDFSYSGAFSVYHWELFYHIPLFIAQQLSQNQQFEDAQTWFQYIFNPTRQGSDPVPQRFWIPQPLHNLTSAEILAQQINNLLVAVNQGDPSSVAQIQAWRSNPFNPFLLADQRPVAYMKSTVMSYLDNLIAWGDNLFSTESREALSEATLLYVIASEILGQTPSAVTPPQHADESFDQLEPSLDAFANAMVGIENVIGGSGGSGGVSGGGIPNAQTFYFKIPPNQTLLNYWSTVADRLFKLRNCQNIAGAPLQLQLFDAPIDPGLLIAAQAAGVDLSSVLSDAGAPLPNYRFTSLYPQALDFVNAVRAYGASLQAALEKTDAGALTLLQQTLQQQLLSDGSQILDWQVQQAQNAIDAANQTLALAQQKLTFNSTQSYMNAFEIVDASLTGAGILIDLTAFSGKLTSALAHLIPDFDAGATGAGGSPTVKAKDGGSHAGNAADKGAEAVRTLSAVMTALASLARAQGTFQRRQDNWKEAAAEAQIQVTQANAQISSANLALQVAQRNQTLHQEQIDNIQKQIDFLNDKFTSDSLYDWMVGSLSATYFQSYQLAYQMCKQVERCYQFELGIQNSSFIQFGYWDNLHKGLLAGETLNHDLRRMQSSYLQQNARRYELSRYVSLGLLSPAALQQLLVTGACDFTLPELLFDNDYPGHYNRRLTRVSLTVVYPSPGKFDNVKATLTLVANQVRVKTDISSGYAENPPGSDVRFLYNYAAVPQKIAMGNAQDDPGLFITAISSNIVDQRYLPFENAGAISSWHLEMPQSNNEFDVSTVGDVVLHLYYTALEGGDALKSAAQANNAANAPTSGTKVFSAQNDFTAPPASFANPYPLSPWQAFLGKPFDVATTLAWPITAAQTSITVASDTGFPAPPFLINIGSEILQVTAVGGTSNTSWTVTRAQQGTQSAAAAQEAVTLLPASPPSQILILAMTPAKFPPWTRGKTISVTSLTVIAIAWAPGNFVLAPQAQLPTPQLVMTPVAGVTEPNICAATIAMPPNTPLGTWSFELQIQGAADFHSLSKNAIGDVLLLVNFETS
jgi:hypothetical protein